MDEYTTFFVTAKDGSQVEMAAVEEFVKPLLRLRKRLQHSYPCYHNPPAITAGPDPLREGVSSLKMPGC